MTILHFKVYFTVTLQIALHPLFILTVIFALPFFNAFIFPVFLFTETILLFEVVHLEKYTCSECNDSYSKAVPKTGHIIGNWKVSKKPTIFKAGKEEILCTVCKKTLQERDIKKLKAIMPCRWNYFCFCIFAVRTSEFFNSIFFACFLFVYFPRIPCMIF